MFELQLLERMGKLAARFSQDFSIVDSVGEWSKGAGNKPSDVETVQILLEIAATVFKRKDFNPMGLDGKISRVPGRSSTVRAIKAYQKTFMRSPDGLVEPGGRTIKKLTSGVQGGTPQSRATAKSVSRVSAGGDGLPGWIVSLFQGAGGVSLPAHDPAIIPKWVSIAEDELGTEEILGKEHNPRIIEYHKTTNSAKTDENPWCASFVNWVFEKAGYKGTKSAWSHSWKTWGERIANPALGSVAVIDWGKIYAKKKGKGHVGFVVGKTANGKIVLLGGNQKDTVKYAAFGKSLIETYRVPHGYDVRNLNFQLPVIAVKKGGSGFEATR